MAAYEWHSAARIKADANAAGKQFEELAETKGLTAETLLEANRPEGAPLHSEFEWDDTTAAEEYRKSQARYLIRSLMIIREGENTQPVRAVFCVSDGGYEPTEKILRAPEKKDLLLKQVARELQQIRNKYAELVQLAEVINAIDEFLARV